MWACLLFSPFLPLALLVTHAFSSIAYRSTTTDLKTGDWSSATELHPVVLSAQWSRSAFSRGLSLRQFEISMRLEADWRTNLPDISSRPVWLPSFDALLLTRWSLCSLLQFQPLILHLMCCSAFSPVHLLRPSTTSTRVGPNWPFGLLAKWPHQALLPVSAALLSTSRFPCLSPQFRHLSLILRCCLRAFSSVLLPLRPIIFGRLKPGWQNDVLVALLFQVAWLALLALLLIHLFLYLLQQFQLLILHLKRWHHVLLQVLLPLRLITFMQVVPNCPCGQLVASSHQVSFSASFAPPLIRSAPCLSPPSPLPLLSLHFQRFLRAEMQETQASCPFALSDFSASTGLPAADRSVRLWIRLELRASLLCPQHPQSCHRSLAGRPLVSVAGPV